VETPEQRDYLLGLGCALQQGYLHGRPMPADQLRKLMADAESEALA
jgi:EAL domain-containing protein (putative c-di-GMP-specific phosphodiesterase class I)